MGSISLLRISLARTFHGWRTSLPQARSGEVALEYNDYFCRFDRWNFQEAIIDFLPPASFSLLQLPPSHPYESHFSLYYVETTSPLRGLFLHGIIYR